MHVVHVATGDVHAAITAHESCCRASACHQCSQRRALCRAEGKGRRLKVAYYRIGGKVWRKSLEEKFEGQKKGTLAQSGGTAFTHSTYSNGGPYMNFV